MQEKLIDKLVEECSENIDGNEMIYNEIVNDYGNVCNCCTISIVIFVIAFLIIIGIISAFIYFHCYLQKDDTIITDISSNTQTTIYQIYRWEISNKLRLKIEHITFLMT